MKWHLAWVQSMALSTRSLWCWTVLAGVEFIQIMSYDVPTGAVRTAVPGFDMVPCRFDVVWWGFYVIRCGSHNVIWLAQRRQCKPKVVVSDSVRSGPEPWSRSRPRSVVFTGVRVSKFSSTPTPGVGYRTSSLFPC